MRFHQLSLERFGRFEGCELEFRNGAPDLHIVYGANEAGKTTCMAAVSELLFGFEPRSRYNFLFEYPLLRIGAVLEEDGRTLVIRRRKANMGSLVDAGDKQVDDGPLVAMLHGQTRESFRLAFSLDHLRLREGGHAIVQAKNDVGQALFAAGSGMTGVTTVLKKIEEEADAIWGPRRAQNRSFTQAERAYNENRALARDRQVRPKAWTDAQGALAEAEAERARAERERDALLAEQRQLERLRRIGPAMQRRAELLKLLAADQGVVVLAPAREERILGALDAAARAERERSTAAMLLGEIDEHIVATAADPAVLAASEDVEGLVERRGAMAKAQLDADRLLIERRLKEARIAELRRDLGMTEQELPSRPAVARLRALVRAYGEASATLHSIAEAQEETRARIAPLERRLADAKPAEGLTELAAAVDAAHRLGDELDARCHAAFSDVDKGRTAVKLALSRLQPWTGDAESLARLPGVTGEEIAAVDAELARLRDRERSEAEEARRLADESARLALDRAALAGSGHAVSEAELADARRVRDEQWRDLRDALCGLASPVDPAGAGNAYEQAVERTDELADRRFAFAEDSGRLGLLDQQAAGLDLSRNQAEARRASTKSEVELALSRWTSRLEVAGFPPLEPARLRAWLIDRTAALEANALLTRLDEQAISVTRRRQEARAALLALMPDVLAEGDQLLPALREAERRRAAREEQEAEYRADQAEYRQLNETLESQDRQAKHRADDRARAAQEWQELQVQLGLALVIDEGDAHLSLVDELRTTIDEVKTLSARLRGIELDRARFEADLSALWSRLAGQGEASLDRLRDRLTTARVNATALAQLESERKRRADEIEAAFAAHAAAMESIAPLVEETGIATEELDAAVQASRRSRGYREALTMAENEVVRGGEGFPLVALEEQWRAADPDAVALRADALVALIAEANRQVTATADAVGEARRTFAALDVPGADAANAASQAEEARAEMAAQAEAYMLRRAQAIALRWAIERYRQERQDPLLARAAELFRRLTLGRYAELRIDYDGTSPRLLGVRDGGRQAIDVEAMSDGTADQLFLALRLAAAEQSVAAGVRLPFLADDLFINFDDDRARAGFEVLAEIAATTQILFFTHHRHLADIAREVVGAELHSECALA
ncbi:hypothetical protein AC629_13395 [Bradyrhizobium sp. NAS80.1]|uniref:ATP-binding protein n=1 Tax=Bradyrhizobium sp. NAS80.1 TaxID=1680159 RepID=UPI00096601D0|nr:YhaN family protein [Bradyrhizobium sp. NAS80.1]OKO87651.1 hypothetical protein AC629_13395 [Bradyrhizobium sp. NAS80.1]